MIPKILLHELRQQVRNKIFWILAPLTLTLALLVAFTHWQQQQSFLQSQQQWQQKNEELWQTQPDRHPHRVAHYGSMVFKPVSPLSFIDAGVNPFVGNALFLEAHRQNSASVKQIQFGASNLALGYPSLATLVLVLWPLILITLGYSTFSNERERGTLKMALALGVSWRALLLGKAAAYGLISLILLLILFGGVALMMLGVAASAEQWLRFTALFGLYGLYCGIWVMAVVAVSAVSRTNQLSLWSLLCSWLLVAVLIPRVIPVITEAIYPIPNRASFDVALAATLEKMGDSHNPNDPHFAQFREQVLQRYLANTVEELPVNWRGLLMTEGERLTSVAFQAHHDELHQLFDRQNAVRNSLAWISPYALAALLSSRLAGTDAGNVAEFERQAEAFRYDMIQKLNHHHTHEIQFHNDREQKLNQQTWLDFSGFEFKPQSLAVSLQQSGLLFLPLLPWLALLYCLGNRSRVARSLV